MKGLIAATLLVTAIASPALAQRSGHSNPNVMHYEDSRNANQVRSMIPANESNRPNEVIGNDPDANVRLDLRRDQVSHD
jgi:hypothetical protein